MCFFLGSAYEEISDTKKQTNVTYSLVRISLQENMSVELRIFFSFKSSLILCSTSCDSAMYLKWEHRLATFLNIGKIQEKRCHLPQFTIECKVWFQK